MYFPICTTYVHAYVRNLNHEFDSHSLLPWEKKDFAKTLYKVLQ